MTEQILSEPRTHKNESSIFHTSTPRNVETKIHLLLVFFTFASALVCAIVFAEYRHSSKTLLVEKQHMGSRDMSITASQSNQ